MRITITGGTGFLGAHLALELIARGHFPTVVARGVSQRGESLRKVANLNFMPMLLNDERKLFQAFNNCDGIAHLVGINREIEKGDFQKVHVEATVRVLNTARKAGVERILFVSFINARPRSFSKYLETKWEAEELIRKSELDYTILKPGMIFGAGDHMLTHISRALDTFPLFAPVGLIQPKIRPVAVQDMVDIMIRCFQEHRLSRQTVAVLGPEEMTLSKAVGRVAKAKRKLALQLPLPALSHYMLASMFEKVSSDPLVSVAQIRMLSESMNKPLKNCDDLPEDMQPKTYLTEELIRTALGG